MSSKNKDERIYLISEFAKPQVHNFFLTIFTMSVLSLSFQPRPSSNRDLMSAATIEEWKKQGTGKSTHHHKATLEEFDPYPPMALEYNRRVGTANQPQTFHDAFSLR